MVCTEVVSIKTRPIHSIENLFYKVKVAFKEGLRNILLQAKQNIFQLSLNVVRVYVLCNVNQYFMI